MGLWGLILVVLELGAWDLLEDHAMSRKWQKDQNPKQPPSKSGAVAASQACARQVREELLSRGFVEIDAESRAEFDLKWGPRVKALSAHRVRTC